MNFIEGHHVQLGKRIFLHGRHFLLVNRNVIFLPLLSLPSHFDLNELYYDDAFEQELKMIMDQSTTITKLLRALQFRKHIKGKQRTTSPPRTSIEENCFSYVALFRT